MALQYLDMNYDFALIIPCYNEVRRLPRTLDELSRYFKTDSFWQNKKVVLVVVNDGSSDETSEVVKKFEIESSEFLVIKGVEHGANQGKGAAIKTGCRAVAASAYGFTDADLSYRIEDIAMMVEKLSDADAVIGERIIDKTKSGYSKFRSALSNALTWLVRQLTGVSIVDTQCGFKFFNQKVAHEVLPHVAQNRFSFDVDFLGKLMAGGYRITTVPVSFHHNDGSSVTTRDGVRYLLDVAAIADQNKHSNNRPFYIFLGSIASVLTFGIFGWTLFKGYFFSDDFTWLWFGKRIIADPSLIFKLRAGNFFSPAMNIFYAVFYKIFGVSAPALFAIGLLAHIIVAILFGVLVYQLSHSRIATVMCVALVALAGSAYEPLVWVGANMHSFVALLILITAVCYGQYLLTDKTKYLIWGLFSFLTSLITKEMAVIQIALIGLLMIFHVWQGRKIIFPFMHRWFLILVSAYTVLYGIFEYAWQTDSATVNTGLWHLGIKAIVRIPLVITDLFIPLKPFVGILNNTSGIILSVVTLVALVMVAWRYRAIALVPIGYVWILISIAPTLFFETSVWWEPLASRYTYIPRLGAIMIVAGILTHYIVKNRSRHVIHYFATILMVVSAFQIGYMMYVVKTEYAYVYKTGRTLVHAASLLKNRTTFKLFVHPEHPFRGNDSHLIGAINTIANVPEDNIIFVHSAEVPRLAPGDMILYWNPEARQYELTNHVDILLK